MTNAEVAGAIVDQPATAPPHGHAHPPHGHQHGTGVSTEPLPAPSGAGSVLVDIGGDIGAAVVNTPSSLDGEEIEIRPEPGAWTGQHVAVRPRPLPDRTIYAAFFEALRAGHYMVRVRFGPPGAPELPLEVTGGTVARIVWPAG